MYCVIRGKKGYWMLSSFWCSSFRGSISELDRSIDRIVFVINLSVRGAREAGIVYLLLALGIGWAQIETHAYGCGP